jgi:RNA polymerase sigma-70 factor, ECF subfamily
LAIAVIGLSLPSLRAFAISLTGGVDLTDDLVQETILRALSHADQFEAGTNLPGWLVTILRNQYYTHHRRRRREVEDVDGSFSGKLATPPSQPHHMDFEDLCSALAKLSPEQREAILLVGAQGFTYEQAAAICGTQVGTIKSRVNRARNRLAELLNVERTEDVGPDRVMQAVAGGGQF